MKKKLSLAPLNVDDDITAPAETSMDVDQPLVPAEHVPVTKHRKLKPIEPIDPSSDDELDEDDEEVEPLPDALRQSLFGKTSYRDDEDDEDDDDDDFASMEMRRILSSNR